MMYVIRFNNGKSDISENNFVAAIKNGEVTLDSLSHAKVFHHRALALKAQRKIPFLSSDFYYLFKIRGSLWKELQNVQEEAQ